MVDIWRDEIEVDGVTLSALRSGREGQPVLLVHGTFWSRVWAPVLPHLGAGQRAVALDLPGFGRSDGELGVDDATVPALAGVLLRAADALGFDRFAVAGHDIGGGIAQHLAVHAAERVTRLALVNGVLLDSWPVPAVERFADPEVRAATSAADLLEARRASLGKAVARELSADEIEEYLEPWRDERRSRSWMAMAAAADARYTLELVPALTRRAEPTLLVWGVDDEFQRLEFAERFEREIPGAQLMRVPGRHIPMEDAPDAVGTALAAYFDT